MLACSGTIEIGSFGVYSLLSMMMFVLGKSSMDKATAYIPFSVWVALNVIVHVSLNILNCVSVMLFDKAILSVHSSENKY